MHPFGTQLLRAHYAAIGWDPDNDYSRLTKPTQALLDLNFVPGLHFTLGKFPAQQFSNSAALSVLSPPSNIPLDQRTSPHHSLPYPTLTGSVSYVTSNVKSFQFIPTRSVPLTNIVDRFAVPFPPQNKSSDSEPANDYLLYGRFHLPSYRLDALYSQRFSNTLQGLATLVSIPTSMTTGLTNSSNYNSNPENSPTNHMSSNAGFGGPSIWNLMVSINHDTGKWSQQYNYSTEDGLFGARVLHNFATKSTTTTRRRGNNNNNNNNVSTNPSNIHHPPSPDDDHPAHHPLSSDHRQRLVDEDEVMDNVLKGRFSMGGELYFSAQKKSAGVSTGIRFCTIPDPPGSVLTQQPTVISATLNPIMGQISTSYGTKIGPNLALATRFDFNLFSFDSDITFGLEWLQKKKKQKKNKDSVKSDGSKFNSGSEEKEESYPNNQLLDFNMARDGKDFTSTLMESPPTTTSMTNNNNNNNGHLVSYFWRTVSGLEDILSILKARVSPVTGLTLMWEGRWKECLIGIGIQSEFLVSSRLPSSSSSSSSSFPTTTTTTNINKNNNTQHQHHLNSNASRDPYQSPLIKGICFQLQYTN